MPPPATSLKPAQPGSALALVDASERLAMQSGNLAALCGLKRNPGRLGDLFDAASTVQLLAAGQVSHLEPLSIREAAPDQCGVPKVIRLISDGCGPEARREKEAVAALQRRRATQHRGHRRGNK